MACGYAKYTGTARRAASPPRARAASTCSTASTTPSSTASRCSRSPAMHVPRPDRHAHPAGRRARQAVHGRRASTTSGSWARRTSRTSSTWPAARRSPTAAWRTSPSRSTSRSSRSSDASAPSATSPAPRSDVLARAARTCRREDELRRAADDPERRQEGRHPGRPGRARRATDELEQVAERLGAPIVKALLGKAAVPDDSPYTTGGIGLLGTAPSQEAMEECDTLLMVGSIVPVHRVLPEARPGARRPDRPRSRRASACAIPVEVGLVGDAGRTLAGAAAAARAQRGPLASSRQAQERHEGVAGADGGARHARRTCR